MKSFSSALIFTGLVGILLGVALLILIFYPVLREEVNYTVSSKQDTPIKPIDGDFGIVIPKIRANSKIVANVNPYDERQYQFALTKGVAQARGTVFPGEVGNIFLFSHSSVNFYEASRYNSIFYLLSKLEPGDVIDLYYKKQKFEYKVMEKKMVDAAEVSYLSGAGSKKTVTLMTCWPPGTTYKRLLVIAEMI